MTAIDGSGPTHPTPSTPPAPPRPSRTPGPSDAAMTPPVGPGSNFTVGDWVSVLGDRPGEAPWRITKIVADDPRHDGPYALLESISGSRSWAAMRIVVPPVPHPRVLLACLLSATNPIHPGRHPGERPSPGLAATAAPVAGGSPAGRRENRGAGADFTLPATPPPPAFHDPEQPWRRPAPMPLPPPPPPEFVTGVALIAAPSLCLSLHRRSR